MPQDQRHDVEPAATTQLAGQLDQAAIELQRLGPTPSPLASPPKPWATWLGIACLIVVAACAAFAYHYEGYQYHSRRNVAIVIGGVIALYFLYKAPGLFRDQHQKRRLHTDAVSQDSQLRAAQQQAGANFESIKNSAQEWAMSWYRYRTARFIEPVRERKAICGSRSGWKWPRAPRRPRPEPDGSGIDTSSLDEFRQSIEYSNYRATR